MVSFSRMSDQWGPGIRTGKVDVVWDVAKDAPEVFDAVIKASPVVADVVDGMRAGVPVMASSAPGEQGELYRIRGQAPNCLNCIQSR